MMFEHLDDPAELRVGPPELARVLRRSVAIRTRRKWIVAVFVSCALVAASVGFILSRPPNQPSSIASNYRFNLVKGPVPLGAAVPTTALLDVEFASTRDGFALALHRNNVVLATSNDGGSSWKVRNNQLPAGLGANGGYPGQFEFTGSTGFLWGARTSAGAPLWMSHDDGATWHAVPIGPYVYDVSAIDLNIWALSGTCPIASSSTSSCAVTLEQSLDGGATWASLGALLTTSPGESIDSRSIELARITKTRSYVLTNVPRANDTPAWQLAFTADAGTTWTNRPVPCGGAFSQGAEVAASSSEDLWLLCGSQATAGAQSKQLYRSDDGGQTWELDASATGLGTTPPSSVPPNPLPLSGYIAPFTVGHHNLAVASSATAWLFPSRGDLYKTEDGGSSWGPVADLSSAGFGDGGQGNIAFLSATQGWICEYGVGLWQTNDGVSWHPLGAG
jgi:hypothetical protein